MRSIKKFLVYSALATSLFLNNLEAQDTDQGIFKRKKNQEGINFLMRALGFSFYPELGNIENIPEEERYFHIRKSIDPKNNAPIQPGNLGNVNVLDLEYFALGWAYNKENFEFIFGTGIGNLWIYGYDKRIHARAYINNPGFDIITPGEEFTYYKVEFEKNPYYNVLHPFLELGYYIIEDYKLLTGISLKNITMRKLLLERGSIINNKIYNQELRELGALNFYDIYFGTSIKLQKPDFRVMFMLGVQNIFKKDISPGIEIKDKNTFFRFEFEKIF